MGEGRVGVMNFFTLPLPLPSREENDLIISIKNILLNKLRRSIYAK